MNHPAFRTISMLAVSGVLLPLHGQVPHKQVAPSARPPASTLPGPTARQSTALAAAARINPAQPKQLPALSLQDADGKAVETGALARKGRWLLLYRRASCDACDRLMAGLAQGQGFNHGAAIAVVVEGAKPDAISALRTQFPEWSGATWAADQQGTAAKALKMRGTPVLYGMDGTTIAFAQAGTPGGADQVGGAAASWAAQQKASAESVAQQ